MVLVLSLSAVACACALRVLLARRAFVPVASGSEASVSAIIPARNEEARIRPLLDSLAAQEHRPVEVIVVDDGSTDGTAEVARAAGARVIPAGELPEGWKGKPWACQVGAGAATGDWLLFLDADLSLAPDSFAKLQGLCEDSKRVTSICPYHRIGSWGEELSSFFNLIMIVGTGAFTSGRETRHSVGLFGQSLLIARGTYEEVDGHACVRDKVLENLYLAQHLQAVGSECRCYLGRGVVEMRMFPGGLPEIWAGWKKGFTTGAAQANGRALTLVSLWLSAGMLILTALVVALVVGTSVPGAVALAGAYGLYAIQCLWAFRLAGSFRPWNGLLFPVTLLFYQVLFFTALLEKARGVRTNWRGRDVD